MLGNSNPTSKGAIFLKIFDGQIVQEWKEKPEHVLDVKERVNKLDRKVYYVTYEFLEGRIVDCELDVSDYGETVKLTILDGTEKYILDIGANSRYGTSFFQRMMNIDLNAPIKIRPYAFEDKEGKNRIGVSLSQNGTKLEWAYTMEEVPQLVAKVRGTKTEYDDTDRYNFFIAELSKFQAKVKTSSPIASNVMATISGTVDLSEDLSDFDSDLPF